MTVKCKQCKEPLYRVPRSPFQKLLIGSKRFACSHCGRVFVKFFGILFKTHYVLALCALALLQAH